MTVYITADRKRVVPAGHPDAAYGVAEPDIDRLGLRAAYEESIAPPEMEAPKQAPKPANKMRKPQANKTKKGGG